MQNASPYAARFLAPLLILGLSVQPGFIVAEDGVDTTPPSFSNIAAWPIPITAGGTLTIHFTASEELAGNPTVTINGTKVANHLSHDSSLGYTYGAELYASDGIGDDGSTVNLSITGTDLAGNTGTVLWPEPPAPAPDPAPPTPYERGFNHEATTADNFLSANPGSGMFAVDASINGQVITDGTTITLDLSASPTFTASTTIVGTAAMDSAEAHAIVDHSLITTAYINIYKGALGSGTTYVQGYAIGSDGILSEAPPLGHIVSALSIPTIEAGDYYIVVYPAYQFGQYPEGWDDAGFGHGTAPLWDFWSAQDFFAHAGGMPGPQIFSVVRFTVAASSTPDVETPDATASSTPAISSVLFLPGIKGSRLYGLAEGCTDISVSGCEYKFWEPGLLHGNDDIRALFLNEDGTSTRDDVFVKDGDVLSSAGGTDYYASFINDMNALVASTTVDMTGWKPVAYDWRLSLNDLVNKGAETNGRIYYENATSTPYIEQTLRSLAASSKTGKVTLIAHSNGGLVAKALMEKIGASGTAALIDKVVFVGVPQSGAPRALGSLFYGYGEGIPRDWFDPIVSKTTTREFAEDSPMAYHLLPSMKYFSDTQDAAHPVASFVHALNTYQKERDAYGQVIGNWTELKNFILALDGGREKPTPSDFSAANVGNAALLDYASSEHGTLDSWTPPSGVSVYQIAGWGVDTIASIDFYDLPSTAGVLSATTAIPSYRPVFTEDGDGVVTIPSALMMSTSTDNVKRYWVNLQEYRDQEASFQEHGDILEINSLRLFVSKILNNDISDLPSYIRTSQPTPVEDKKKLIFYLHSPLTLQVQDSSGNITGIGTDGSVTENIADSSYGEFGDVKFAIAPEGQYSLVMHGQSSGTFSLEIQELSGNTVVASTTLAAIPTTANTVASLSTSGTVAALSPLSVDTDGNGTSDFTVTPQAGETVVYESSATEEVAPTISDGNSNNTPISVSTGGGGHHSSITQSDVSIPEPQAVAPEPSAVTARGPSAPVSTAVPQQPVAPRLVVIPETNESAVAETTRFYGVSRVISQPFIRTTFISSSVPVRIPSPEVKNDTRPTQTASVYDAFSQQVWLTQFLQFLYTLIHALWQAFLYIINFILNLL